MTYDRGKEAAALCAMRWVREGMTIGLGSGSTAERFIYHLIRTYQGGRTFRVACSSCASEALARKGQLPLIPLDRLTSLDLTVDGADVITPDLQLIKGAGGALVREKILANMSNEVVIIADTSKYHTKPIATQLPIEVVPFAPQALLTQLAKHGFKGIFRQSQGALWHSDNGNWTIDLELRAPFTDYAEIHSTLLGIPGVIDTGLFIGLADKVILGHPSQKTRILSAQ